jgi:hypothetical protein
MLSRKKEEKNGGRGFLQGQVGRNCEGGLCGCGNFLCRLCMMHQVSGCRLVDKLRLSPHPCASLFFKLIEICEFLNQVDPALSCWFHEEPGHNAKS